LGLGVVAERVQSWRYQGRLGAPWVERGDRAYTAHVHGGIPAAVAAEDSNGVGLKTLSCTSANSWHVPAVRENMLQAKHMDSGSLAGLRAKHAAHIYAAHMFGTKRSSVFWRGSIRVRRGSALNTLNAVYPQGRCIRIVPWWPLNHSQGKKHCQVCLYVWARARLPQRGRFFGCFEDVSKIMSDFFGVADAVWMRFPHVLRFCW
jgi:hypothetical protein